VESQRDLPALGQMVAGRADEVALLLVGGVLGAAGHVRDAVTAGVENLAGLEFHGPAQTAGLDGALCRGNGQALDLLGMPGRLRGREDRVARGVVDLSGQADRGARQIAQTVLGADLYLLGTRRIGRDEEEDQLVVLDRRAEAVLRRAGHLLQRTG